MSVQHANFSHASQKAMSRTALAMSIASTARITIKATPQTLALAKNLIWFEPPEQALRNPIRFLAYAFARADFTEMAL